MTTISGTTSTTASTSVTNTGAAGIADNFTQFLSLLTTQLQNQSPLDPLDTNQFTEQLVQFASVEQQLKTNDTLSSLLTSTQASTTANAAGYVGLTITADGSTQSLAAGGTASWTLTPSKAAAKATVTIKDANGAVVVSKTATLAAGTQTYTWDGKDASGTAQPAGDYTIAVTGTDSSGQGGTVWSDVGGTVSAVNVAGTSPVLTVGGVSVPLSKVKTLASS